MITTGTESQDEDRKASSALVDTASAKSAVRTMLRNSRRRFSAGLSDVERGAALDRIYKSIRPLISGVGSVSAYLAQDDEPVMLPFLNSLHASGRLVLLPRVRDGRMEFVAWSPNDLLVRGYAGILEPKEDGRICDPQFLLIPLLGFDRYGGRIGQGGGFYDRYLATRPATTRIGVAWSIQELGSVPTEPWDVAMSAIVTELETITVGAPRVAI
jgi:5-formyltetrahydrofolate cyclo-ligase